MGTKKTTCARREMANIFSFSDLKKDEPQRGPPGGGFGGPPGGGFGGMMPGGSPARQEPDRKKVIMVTSAQEFQTQLANAGGLVVVDWSASWCRPCQQIFPFLADLSEKYPDTVFLKVDVDRMRALSDQHNITALPTFHFFKNSQRIDELQGAEPRALEQKVQQHNVSVKKWSGGYSLKDESAQVFVNRPVASGGAGGAEPLEPLVTSLVEMGFPENHVKKALSATGNQGLEQAIDWIVNNPDDGTDFTPAPTVGGSSGSERGDPMNWDDEDDASDDLKRLLAENKVRQLGSRPNPQDSEPSPDANTPSNTEDSTPSPDPQPEREKTRAQLSWEEREKQMNEKLAAIKEQKRKQEEKEELERERKRVKDAANISGTLEHLEDVRRKAEIQESKRKKLADKRAREEIRRKIQAAKQERAAKTDQSPSIDPAHSPNTPPQAQSPAQPSSPISTECALAIRLPNGKTVKHTFPSSANLRSVHDLLISEVGRSGFSLVTNYPRKVYSGSALDSTSLTQAQLVPRGALSVQM